MLLYITIYVHIIYYTYILYVYIIRTYVIRTNIDVENKVNFFYN